MKTLKAIDLCAGAGGWACAAKGLPIEIVAAVDFWEPACQTYRLNWPLTTVIEGDLRDVDVQAKVRDIAEAQGVQLLLGGIPCGWLSVVRRAFHNTPKEAERSEERATLAAVLVLVERIAPRWWCLEDVPAIVDELPAGTPWIALDSADFSAQRRKRVYVGRFPRPQGVGPLMTPRSKAVLAALLRPGPYRIGRRAIGRTLVTASAYAPDTACASRPADKAPTVCCVTSRRDVENLVRDEWLPGGVRQLEWQEAAALQGFPTDYLFFGSASDVGKQIGRAVQIDTARVILRGIVKEWEQG